MTRKYTLLLFSLSSIFIFSTCKKGEDDPSISLRTRKMRLAGEWRLISGNASLTTDGYNETYAFDGSSMVITSTLYYPYNSKYLLSLIIEKDGTFTFRELIDGVMLDAAGTWNFNTGIGEPRKKEEVLFSIDKVNKGYTNGYNLFNRYNVNFTYTIKELRNKRLVIKSSGKIYSDVNGNYMTLSTDYVFQQ